MSLKDLLISFSNGRTSETVLKFGLALAGQTGASVSAIHVTQPILEPQQFQGWMPEALMEQISKANSEAPEKAKTALKEELANLGAETEVHWVSVGGGIADCLAAAARTRDLLVIGKYSETTEEAGTHVRSEQIVTQSGRPLIVVPGGWDGGGLQRIVVAWDGGPTAARALFDVIHLLPNIDEIHIVSVAHAGNGEMPLSEIERYLACHNLNTTMAVLPPKGNTASRILGYCEEYNADLLVVGSRGTARLRGGLVHGGTGRSFFDQAQIPIFVSQ